ncbi:hypothetical protein [Alkalimarinus coralli]|uniref:hypothetical protein n=1 Tax=Alkalimarinus coralli TaxID=2935863 RepID=UPI00202ADC31|nr:hypothetical protein [Alkalimarinus coralli]
MQRLLKEIELHSRKLPDEIQQEVLDFIKLKERTLAKAQKEKIEVSMLSEQAMSDWANEEEDEAWSSFQ